MSQAKRRACTTILAFAALMVAPLAAHADCRNVGPATVGACPSPQGSSQPNPSSAGGASRLLSLTNNERSTRGLGTLGTNATLQSIAAKHAQDMADAGRIYHNGDLFSASTREQLGNPDEIGENVGKGTDVDSIHRAFMGSTDHRENILERGYVTTGFAVVSAKGDLWVVETFMSRPHSSTGGVFHNSHARSIVEDIPPAVARNPEIAAFRWHAPPSPEAATVTETADTTQVLGVSRSFRKVTGGHGSIGIIVAMAFSVVVGAALPRRRDDAEYV